MSNINTEIVIITKAKTKGNFSGCCMEFWIGMISPMPSNAKMAVPMKMENLDLLMTNSTESLTPLLKSSKAQKVKTITNPPRIKIFARKEVNESLETLLMNESGMNNTAWKT
ncbi:hypothetical protein WICPIJ_007322 [Wickerhamomyces pijperi]|uniref:Uncharacterized protein n=1 Tax=Wickerhamomyces pijperi TaxID=599730 RepID=A0A9P8Q1Z5_WICPI|nr:hypothetical protein WICPIJ_007322 [Wickerhamomyces pijperi]